MTRKSFLTRLAAASAALVLAPFLADATGSAQAAMRLPTSVSASPSRLDGNEIAGLKYMREEEKVAHDLYVTFYTLWGTPVFDNISRSESSHMTAMLSLLRTYSIADPVASNPPGVFTDYALQMLHDTLLAKGRLSELEALKVGALIEETDIKDIRDRQALTDEARIISVYDSLTCGSRNHLRAFNNQLLKRKVKYEATVISQAEWDAIAYSANERCQ